MVIYLRNFLLFKNPLSSVDFFCFSLPKKKRSHIKNFSDGIERFILGLQFDKIALNEYNSTKIDKKTCNPHSRHASKRSAEYQTTVLLKFFNNNSYNLYECFDNHPIKITSGFWIVTSLNSFQFATV